MARWSGLVSVRLKEGLLQVRRQHLCRERRPVSYSFETGLKQRKERAYQSPPLNQVSTPVRTNRPNNRLRNNITCSHFAVKQSQWSILITCIVRKPMRRQHRAQHY